MKQMLKLQLVSLMVATFLTSDTTLSSTAQVSPIHSTLCGAKLLSKSSAASVSTIRKPKYLASPNWGTTAYIPVKP